MFKGFDYGKGLKKQLDATKRAPANQRQRREPKLAKMLESYCKKFLDALNNSGSTNPGLLKNAAEVIVDTCRELGDATQAYTVFADMVSRSRKVPVIPGLAGLVDNLLELETQLKAERLSMLNWRITTGNMRVDRYLDYQCQRARLSNSSEHWKDFCWALLQLVKKGTIKPIDTPALNALEILKKKQHELGDKIIDVMMLLAEARYSQKDFVDMEKCLMHVATGSDNYPDTFYELLDMLLGERSETCWELHQLSLNRVLEEVVSGRLGWSTAETVITRGRKHREQRLDYLLEHDLMVALEPLGRYVFDAVLNLPDNKVHQALLRWRYAYSSRGVDLPDSIRSAYDDAKKKGLTGFDSIPSVVMPEERQQSATVRAEVAVEAEPAPEPVPEPPQMARLEDEGQSASTLTEVEAEPVEPEVVEEPAEDLAIAEPQEPEKPVVLHSSMAELEAAENGTPLEPEPQAAQPAAPEPEAAETEDDETEREPTLAERLRACSNTREFRGILNAAYPLDAEAVEQIEQTIAETAGSDKPWLAYESRLELAGWHMLNRDSMSAEEEISKLEVPLGTEPKSVIARLSKIFGEALPDNVARMIIQNHIAGGDFLQAMVCARRIREDELKQQTLNEIQNWLLEQENPTPLMEIAAADIQRLLSGDRAAELDTAIRAGLLAPDYEPVQRLLSGWTSVVPEADVNLSRAQVAAKLCADAPTESLARAAAAAIVQITQVPGGEAAEALALELATELRPLLETYEMTEELASLPVPKLAETEPEEPEVEEPAAEIVAGEPEIEEPAAEMVAGEPEIEEPAAEMVAGEPEIEEPAAEMVADEPEIEEPAAEMVAEEPEIEEPAVAVETEAEVTADEAVEPEAAVAETEAEVDAAAGEVEVVFEALNGKAGEQPEPEPAEAEPEAVAAETAAAMSQFEPAAVGASAGEAVAASGGTNWAEVTHSDIAGRLDSGDWVGAGRKAGEIYGGTDSDDVGDLTGIYHALPSDAMLPFSEGLAQSFADMEQYSKLIDVLNLIDGELMNGKGELREDSRLQSFIDGTLHSLCEKAFEERFDDTFEFTTKTEAGRQTINDLLILARSGDKTACLQLHKAFVTILKTESDAPQLQVIADVLAPMLKETAPQQSLKLVAQAGLAVNDSRWALSRIDDLGLSCDESESCFLLGRLYLAKNDLQMSFNAVEKLITMGDSANARQLLTQLSEQSSGKLDSMVQLTKMFVLLAPPDYESAFDQLLAVYQLISESNINMKLALAPLAALTGGNACSESHSPDVCKFQLLLFSLLGESDRVLGIIEELHESAPGSAEKLLRAIDRIALQDCAIPPLTVIAWAKSLLLAGRTEDALERLSGIAESGVEYHAYTQLLEEAKRQCETADAHVQLAQAYLRNHLWMRSAEEYRLALSKDPELCEPILTQLKRWGALELDPIKHPVHFLAVQATTLSANTDHWRWALGALPWLRESWPPQKLHELSLSLWQSRERASLDDEMVCTLVEQLIELAVDSNNVESATSLLVEVWEPGSQLAHAMRPVIGNIEKRLRTTNTNLLYQFKKMLLEDTIFEGDAERLPRTARELAEINEQGRQAAIVLLSADNLPDALAAPAGTVLLELLNLDENRERQDFFKLLARLEHHDLPIGLTRTLIHAAVALMQSDAANAELEFSVFRLLRSTGDDRRCGELAAYFAQREQPLAPEASAVIEELATRNNSPQHYLMLAEHELAGGGTAERVYEWLAKAGGRLDHEYRSEVTDLAHALANTDAAAAAHAGLSLAYRKSGSPDRAAQELLWAVQAGSQLDTTWLSSAGSGNLVFYGALLLLLQGREDEAGAQLERLVEGGSADADVTVAARMKLAQLALDRGQAAVAFSQAEAAKSLDPEHPLANEMIDSLKQEIFRERMEAARGQDESPERTLLIAQLHKENGEYDEAVNELQAGIRSGFANENLFLELAECFAMSNQHNISRRAYFEALKRLEQRNGDAELMVRALYGLAQEDIKLGNEEEAISNLEYLLLIKSDYRDAHELIEKLYQTKKKPSKCDNQEVASQVLEQIVAMLGKDPKKPGLGGEA